MQQAIAMPQLKYTIRTRSAIENRRDAAQQRLVQEYRTLREELADKMRGADPVQLVREQRDGAL